MFIHEGCTCLTPFLTAWYMDKNRAGDGVLLSFNGIGDIDGDASFNVVFPKNVNLFELHRQMYTKIASLNSDSLLLEYSTLK